RNIADAATVCSRRVSFSVRRHKLCALAAKAGTRLCDPGTQKRPDKPERTIFALRLSPAARLHAGRLPVGRKGLQRKSHRICMGKSEELERKARFLA
ncbi:MAG: hypothetical protein LBN92_03575, partial [Treponema sp.]|nr:hypothetical protein [Treponema sp.]